MVKETKKILSLCPQTGSPEFREYARSLVRNGRMVSDRHFGACESSWEKQQPNWTLERFENALFRIMAHMSEYWGDHERLSLGYYELNKLFHLVWEAEQPYAQERPRVHVTTEFAFTPKKSSFILHFRSECDDLTSTEDLFDAVRGRIVGVAKRVRERRREMMGDPKYLAMDNGMVEKAPPPPIEGALVYNEATNELLCFTGNEWRPLGGAQSEGLVKLNQATGRLEHSGVPLGHEPGSAAEMFVEMMRRICVLETQVAQNATSTVTLTRALKQQLDEVVGLVESQAERSEIKRAVDKLNSMTDGSLSVMDWQAKHG